MGMRLPPARLPGGAVTQARGEKFLWPALHSNSSTRARVWGCTRWLAGAGRAPELGAQRLRRGSSRRLAGAPAHLHGHHDVRHRLVRGGRDGGGVGVRAGQLQQRRHDGG